ncbi:MAG: hypothetical protein H0T76_21075 [Nannocystis sp.]|nr:hypothetical protein [Nannocystis sp.]MBA3548983.1 hypothetical protein [Nannocystis sp.]
MLPPRRGSPLGEILLFGTCLSLVLPVGPALAEPAGLPDWGVASKKPPPAAPAPEATPTPPPAPTPAPAPEAAAAPNAEPDIVLEPDAEPAAPQSSQAGRRPKSTKSKSKPKPRVQVAAAPTVPAVQPQPAPTPTAVGHKDAAHRNGHGEVLAGALLTTAGLASIGVMSGGLYLNRHSKRELERGEGRPEQELAPLHDQKRQAETMIAAGAIAGAAGLALGIALLTIGARDLKAARREPLSARVRVAPTLGGFVLAGRF